MASRDQWKKSLEMDIEQCDDFLTKAKDISDLVPGMEARKQEAKAKLLFVEAMPESILDELGDRLFEFQKHDEAQLKVHLPGLSGVLPETRSYLAGGTISSSDYLEIVDTYRKTLIMPPYEEEPSPSEREFQSVKMVYTVFSDLAKQRSKKASLRPLLNAIGKEVGEMFVVALASYDKAKSGIVGIDQAAIQMRDVLQHLWGGVVLKVRKRAPNKYKDVVLHWDKKGRGMAVETLTDDPMDQMELDRLLQIMKAIHDQISVTEFGKNPLTRDQEKLDGLYVRWLLVLSDVALFFHMDDVFRNLPYADN